MCPIASKEMLIDRIAGRILIVMFTKKSNQIEFRYYNNALEY